MSCSFPILHTRNNRLSDTLIKKFCNHSCSAKFNNTGNKRSPIDWKGVSEYFNNNEDTIEACSVKFGFSRRTWYDAIKRGDLVIKRKIVKFVSGNEGPSRRGKTPIEDLLVDNRPQTSRNHLKERLIQEGYLENKCYSCGLTEWQDKPLALDLHHLNGEKYDNRLENLTILCPNCHAQTDTYRGKNIKRV